MPDAPCLLFDDARDGGAPPRLYRAPSRVIVAHEIEEVAPALDAVRAALAEGQHVAGFLSYEAGAAFDRSPSRESPTPLAWFGVFDGYETPDLAALLPDPAGAWLGAPDAEITRADYDAAIARVLALIEAGDIYQANLTFRTRVPLLGDPLAAYARLRRAARAGWGAYVDTGEDVLLSLSPELFFALRDGALTCKPMKGTARRLAHAADRAAADALAADPKQRAENLMIVDLMRNDLSRVAVPGSVRVPALFAVESYPSVHQMTSTVAARLAPERDAIDVLAALFPCGSITGAPKLRAMEVIAEVEPSPRGIYTGAIGWIEPGGDAQWNVAIRTLHLKRGDGYATLGLGGGIVADSRAASEWDEALAKGAFVTIEGPPRFDLIETMAFDPEAGIALIERHLARMKVSAEAFGFAFDRHSARNDLQAATFRLRVPSRIRLLLAASGAVAIEVSAAPAPRDTPMRVAVVPLPVSAEDVRLRHKTTDRRFYDAARAECDADEIVFAHHDGTLTEGSFTSLFVPRGDTLVTPPLARGLLPGVLRAELIDTGRAVEGDLTAADLTQPFFVGNALRGLIPAVLAVAES